jgi:hypothetical protein
MIDHIRRHRLLDVARVEDRKERRRSNNKLYHVKKLSDSQATTNGLAMSLCSEI